MKWFNPKAKEFMDANEDKTMIGFAWSLYWRFAITVCLIYLVIGILIALIA